MATATPNSSDTGSVTASEWTQTNTWTDLLQQKAVLIAVGITAFMFFMWSRRRPLQEQAARRLVRDWRNVDDPEDARDLLADNLPPIVRPALLLALQEVHRQVHRAFRNLEREIERL
jgi:hypothetical protein